MPDADTAPLHTFCWNDLATSDPEAALSFYGQAFGWHFDVQRANGGQFIRCRRGDADAGSLYRLSPSEAARGVTPHWTPYLRVDDLDAIVARTESLGARVLVVPFEVEGMARIALIEDPQGARLGLWQALVRGAG